MFPKDLERLPAENYIGQRHYFLTFLTKSRRRYFLEEAVVHGRQSHILRAATHKGIAVLASVYMPDHLHLVVEGTTPQSDLRAFVKLAKQLSGYHVKQQTGHELWERGFHDRIVREGEDLRDYIKYVRENPVKAGLAEKPEDYPFLFVEQSSESPL